MKEPPRQSFSLRITVGPTQARELCLPSCAGGGAVWNYISQRAPRRPAPGTDDVRPVGVPPPPPFSPTYAEVASGSWVRLGSVDRGRSAKGACPGVLGGAGETPLTPGKSLAPQRRHRSRLPAPSSAPPRAKGPRCRGEDGGTGRGSA